MDLKQLKDEVIELKKVIERDDDLIYEKGKLQGIKRTVEVVDKLRTATDDTYFKHNLYNNEYQLWQKIKELLKTK